MSIEQEIHNLNDTMMGIAISLKRIADCCSHPVTGITIQPGKPTTKKENVMASVKMVKKSVQRNVIKKAAPGDKAADFVFQDNQDDTFTVYGVDAGGNRIDISAVAKLVPAPTSGDTTVITVDTPVGMVCTMHAVGKLSVPGTPVLITAVATWNDGSAGPFTFTLPVDVVSGGPTGIMIVPGTPTVH